MNTENGKIIRILGIESSCDETAAAIVENGRVLIADVISTQIDIHKQYGGVFPEVASRQHVLNIYTVIEQTLNKAHLSVNDIDAIAVTRGPGLAGSVIVGVNAAKGLSQASGLPIIGVNHMEGHIYSAWLYSHDSDADIPPEPQFPAIALLVSGGHSEIVLMKDHLKYERLGGTVDDAAGEAFDKTARLLGLEYPGGPSIQKAALDGDAERFRFPRARLEGTWNFSFSGLKTAALRTVREIEASGESLPIADLAASFQKAVVDILFEKTMQAARVSSARNIILAGGVSANRALRSVFLKQDLIPVFIPKFAFCTDNAAMIAAAGYQRYMRGKFDTLDFDILPTWPLSRLT